MGRGTWKNTRQCSYSRTNYRQQTTTDSNRQQQTATDSNRHITIKCQLLLTVLFLHLSIFLFCRSVAFYRPDKCSHLFYPLPMCVPWVFLTSSAAIHRAYPATLCTLLLSVFLIRLLINETHHEASVSVGYLLIFHQHIPIVTMQFLLPFSFVSFFLLLPSFFFFLLTSSSLSLLLLPFHSFSVSNP